MDPHIEPLSPQQVSIDVARADERPILDNMMQYYVHDFSEHWAGLPTGDLPDSGRFDDYPLDPYWEDPTCIPLLARVDGRLAGFALVNARSHSGQPLDRNVAEFFIARKHRRSGAGTIVAHKIFSLYPGVWEAAVARRNVGALNFWRRAVSGHPHVSEIEEADFATSEWNGPILRFRIAA